MSVFSKSQLRFAKLISELINSNPFLPERIALEKKILGRAFETQDANWNLHPSKHQSTPNLDRIYAQAAEILTSLELDDANDMDHPLVVDLLYLVLFDQFRDRFAAIDADHGKSAAAVYDQFSRSWEAFCPEATVPAYITEQRPHMFALLFQIRRAFDNTFRHLIGSSEAIIKLRADVWRSIFTHDVRRYSDTMYDKMCDFPTLITGPTGSGKELVARAIGQSGYVPFDEKKAAFVSPLNELFISLNLSALSPTLIESELFGHAKGAFTGASTDRKGWLEACPPFGAVFLDEIGELDHDIQVKLLRVAQERTFQRLGDRQPRTFHGRIICATNRNLAEEIAAGRFRMDFFYRLCADQIQTPSLADRCVANDRELQHLIRHLLKRILGSNSEHVADDCLAWIQGTLGDHYTWPGNVRELDQCIRSWLIRQEYRPCNPTAQNIQGALEDALLNTNLTADELLTLFCQVKYEASGSYLQTAQQLGLDRRTVKARVDSASE